MPERNYFPSVRVKILKVLFPALAGLVLSANVYFYTDHPRTEIPKADKSGFSEIRIQDSQMSGRGDFMTVDPDMKNIVIKGNVKVIFHAGDE